jgi:hypothetical protein
MGWKASLIIVHKPAPIDNEVFLKQIGFTGLNKIADKTFEQVIDPEPNTLYIGTYKNNLLICVPELPSLLLEDVTTDTEDRILELCPEAEICAVVLHSVVDLWGYAVTVNGEKIRTRAGSGDDGVFIEDGEPLPEELELLSKLESEESFEEDEGGEDFVFAVCKRYFGVELDRAGDDLFETTLSGYSFVKHPEQFDLPAPETVEISKPWWKFW